ncbi:MAG: hypothetical protein DLM62_12145 [Pseudonocardiales bacterium]|nr:MAG: hypothetical protein DLM62_12145 [Pseudonocardiales bacterium]
MCADRHSTPLRVLIDGTPLLGQRSGIGRYTAALLRELAARSDVDVTVTAFTARGQSQLRRAVPAGVAVRGGPVPARALRRCGKPWTGPPPSCSPAMPMWPAWTALGGIPPGRPPDARTRLASAGRPVLTRRSAPTGRPATGSDPREESTG